MSESAPDFGAVFPTGVGMNRDMNAWLGAFKRVPHRRGDEPLAGGVPGVSRKCSPQAWG